MLSERGATFWPELTQAVAQAELLYDDETVSAALWDLVWAGVVTNDSFGAVRAYVAARTRSAGPSRRGVLRRGGPASSVGRWSLVAPLMQPECSATERSHAKAMQLLERYGVLTRQAALGEGTTGGFAGVYPVLKMLEDQGTVRRGYFVSGLGAAQFALPGAVDRLRSARAEDDTQQEPERLILAAADPAQTYGATLRWPSSKGRPSRSAGAYVLLRNGLPVLFVEKGGRSLITFANTDVGPDDVALLKTIVGRHGGRKMEIVNVDGEPVTGSPVADVLRAAGFRDAYRGLRFDAE